MRSNPDGNFWNNWSTVGNVNPYTGMRGTKTSPTGYRSIYPSSWSPSPVFNSPSPAYPGLGIPFEASSYDPAADARAAEQARKEAEIATELARKKEVEDQIRRASEARIRADSLQRRAKWQNQEETFQAEARAQFNLAAARRGEQWQIDETRHKQMALTAMQRNLSDYGRQWDDYIAEAEEFKQADGAERSQHVAEAHTRVKARYAGDGRQAIRDKQRARADAWSNAQRDVREKRSANLRLATREFAEIKYEGSLLARLQADERQRLATWEKQEQEIQAAFNRQARERLATWEREEAVLVAKAQAQAEEQLLQTKEAWAGLRPGTNQPVAPSNDQCFTDRGIGRCDREPACSHRHVDRHKNIIEQTSVLIFLRDSCILRNATDVSSVVAIASH